DPNAPRRNVSAYLHFASKYRDKLREEHPGIQFGEIGKLLGKKWTSFSDQEKKPCEDMAEADKKRYEAEKECYKGPGFANTVYPLTR
ncbi:HMG-box, partial [Mytilinidion resinicola]